MQNHQHIENKNKVFLHSKVENEMELTKCIQPNTDFGFAVQSV